MYRTRSIKFHNGKQVGCDKERVLSEKYRFTEYMMDLCKATNEISKSELVSVKENEFGDWTIKIKTKRKSYHNIIAQRFFKYFNECIIEIVF